ncbi:MAG: glycosyltransferase family 2 protein, partial [Verrucomicrobia bacterium]|nr:glycosyltransferase family 2 protein [Verrucomicrobiota bacterium]
MSNWASVIIATHNRSSQLTETLAALSKVLVPNGWNAELIVVDNASTDNTADVVHSAQLSNFEVRYFYQFERGKSGALNAGIGHAHGDIILFTDDDVTVAVNWLEEMVKATFYEGADVAVGRTVLAENFATRQLTNLQKCWLGATSDVIADPPELLGNNMAIRRGVLDYVPGFDPELGPGRLGSGEESLFGKQLHLAGFKTVYVPSAKVIHRPELFRLDRRVWLSMARMKGREIAYLRYHWQHEDFKFPRLRCLWLFGKLCLRRILHRATTSNKDSYALWEISYVWDLATLGQYCKERQRRRN